MAPLLRLTSADLVDLGIADAVIPDDVEATVAAVVAALDGAVAGDRAVRLQAATDRWLTTEPPGP